MIKKQIPVVTNTSRLLGKNKPHEFRGVLFKIPNHVHFPYCGYHAFVASSLEHVDIASR